MKGTDAMNDPNRLPTEEEIIERLMASRKKPKLIPKPTLRERAEKRFNPARRPTEAVLQDAIRANDAVEERFVTWAEQERQRLAEAQRQFDEDQNRLANDPARSQHMDAAYRRALRADQLAHGSYYRNVGDFIQSIRDAEAAIEASRIYYHRGRGED
jgi:hypothetical protein